MSYLHEVLCILKGDICSIYTGTLADFYPYHIEVILSVAYLVSSVGTAIIPWSGALWVMAIMFHLQGLGEGIIDTCKHTDVIQCH